MKKMKRLLAVLFSFALCFSVFAACGDDSDLDTEGREKVVVWLPGGFDVAYKSTLKKRPNDARALYTKNMVDGFYEANDKYYLDIRDQGWGTALNESIIKAGINTEGIQVDVVPGEVLVPTFIESGVFKDITDLIPEKLAKLSASGQAAATKDGRVYGVSGSISSIALHINTKVLKDSGILNSDLSVKNAAVAAAGINPLAPATFEELEVVCREISESDWKKQDGLRGAIVLNSVAGYSSAFRALAFMRMAGGDFVNADGGVAINSPENKKAFELMRRLSAYAPVGANAEQAEPTLTLTVINGKAAYNIENCDALSRSDLPGLADVITAPLPQFAGNNIKSNSLVGNCIFSIMSNAMCPDGALKFLEYISEKEFQLEGARVNSSIPSNVDALNSAEIKELPKYNIMKNYYAPFVEEGYESFKGIPSVNSTDYWKAWDALIKGILNKTANNNTAYADIQTLMNTCQSGMETAIAALAK